MQRVELGAGLLKVFSVFFLLYFCTVYIFANRGKGYNGGHAGLLRIFLTFAHYSSLEFCIKKRKNCNEWARQSVTHFPHFRARHRRLFLRPGTRQEHFLPCFGCFARNGKKQSEVAGEKSDYGDWHMAG